MEFSFFGTFFLLATLKNQYTMNLVNNDPQSKDMKDFIEVVTDTLEAYKQLIPRLKYKAVEILLYEKAVHIELSLKVCDEEFRVGHYVTVKKDMQLLYLEIQRLIMELITPVHKEILLAELKRKEGHN